MNIGPFQFTNTVSGVVFGGLAIVVAGIVWLLREIYKTRSAAQDASNNTQNISNGFARGVNQKLDNITSEIDKLQNAHTEHLKWHLEREGKEHG